MRLIATLENEVKVDSEDSIQKTGSLSQTEFDALYNEHKTSVLRFAYYLTQNRGEAEDLFQETWLRVVKNFSKISRKSTIKTWIMTIAVNLHRDSLRKKKIRRLFLIQEYKAFKQRENKTTPSTRSKEFVDSDTESQTDISLAISQALVRLPRRQRLVFALKEIEGFKQTEISDMLKIPIGTVKSLMFRAVKRLQQELSSYKPEHHSRNERAT